MAKISVMMCSITLFCSVEKILKQECVLQEDKNSHQGTDGETSSHEVEANSDVNTQQVEDNLLKFKFQHNSCFVFACSK